MTNIFNADFQDFLQACFDCDVRYLLVGGYSVILHGYSRTTGDLDLWVERSAENYGRLALAFQRFGMPVFDMTADNFLRQSHFDVFTFGRPPVAIDIITELKGLVFAEAWPAAELVTIEGLPVRLIQYKHLVRAKKAAGRPRDQNDLDNLALRH